MEFFSRLLSKYKKHVRIIPPFRSYKLKKNNKAKVRSMKRVDRFFTKLSFNMFLVSANPEFPELDIVKIHYK